MGTWNAFWRLEGSDRRLALQAAALLALTHAGLRVAGLRRWQAVVIRCTPKKTRRPSTPSAPGIARARRIARIQEAVSRHLRLRVNCLERSLALWWQLGRRGIASDLRLGARKEGGRFEAHAWVELGDTVLDDSSETHAHYAAFEGSILTTET